MLKVIVKNVLIPVALTTAVFSTGVSAHSDRLNDAMRQMGKDFKQAAKANDVESMSGAVTQLQQYADRALEEGHRSDSDLFDKGIIQLIAGLDKVEATLTTGDLARAKDQLWALDDIKEKYHEKFDVYAF